MFVSRLLSIYKYVVSVVRGGLGDYYYRLFLFFVLMIFLGLRVPYLYGMRGFGIFIFFSVFPLFFSLLLSRLIDGPFDDFFCGFVPPGTPL